MLVTARDRVAKLKKSGQTLQQVMAAAPTKDLDATWGKGFFPPERLRRARLQHAAVSGSYWPSDASKSASDF